jgi:UDP-N-acetylmuramoyl-tripeptide--D-alanyl-D-alanine ligase
MAPEGAVRPRSLADVARAAGGRVRSPGGATGVANGVMARGVSIDSRRVSPGDLFVALAGRHADGHAFVPGALEAGAAAALVARDRITDPPGPLVEVEDPARALLALAADERARIGATVVGITGSTGKTCTKDFAAAVLRARFRVVASPASFNNEVGLPFTILRADERTEALVCEMGARGRGQIRMLCEVARPGIGIVTNVGVAHMELFGSREAIREAKAELPEALGADGVAVLNGDDPVVRGYAARTAARIVTFGTGPASLVRAERIQVDRDTGCSSFELVTPESSTTVRLGVPGEHMVWNALGAAAVGWVAGVSIEAAGNALEKARVSAGRMEAFVAPGGIRVVNDAYNANPTSMSAALRTARWMAGGMRCIAVLGRMAELGPLALEEHERLGELAVRLRIDELVIVGPEAGAIARSAEREGMEPGRIHECSDVNEAAELVRNLARPGDLVLLKASRVARLDRVADDLRAARGPADGPRTEPADVSGGAGT